MRIQIVQFLIMFIPLSIFGQQYFEGIVIYKQHYTEDSTDRFELIKYYNQEGKYRRVTYHRKNDSTYATHYLINENGKETIEKTVFRDSSLSFIFENDSNTYHLSNNEITYTRIPKKVNIMPTEISCIIKGYACKKYNVTVEWINSSVSYKIFWITNNDTLNFKYPGYCHFFKNVGIPIKMEFLDKKDKTTVLRTCEFDEIIPCKLEAEIFDISKYKRANIILNYINKPIDR